MLLVLINSLILLAGLGLPMGALFWKHFADSPGESTRAFIATIAAMLGLVMFFLQTYIMTFEVGQNLITMLGIWLGF